MLFGLPEYLYERRTGLKRAATYIGGVYLVGRYVVERLDEIREKVIEDRTARENLRRRFDQNQQDVSYTIMALLPTLGTHILEGMDVEGVTEELQSQSRASKARIEYQVPPPPSNYSVTSSVELVPNREHDVRSENGSVSVVSSAGLEEINSSDLGSSSLSWADQSSSQVSGASPSNVAGPSGHLTVPGQTIADVDLSSSTTTTSSASSAALGDAERSLRESTVSDAMTSSVTRSKAELWREVKILTFTRTLTIIYSITLLSLFTSVQLNLIGRSKYIQSVFMMERDERTRELFAKHASPDSIYWGEKVLDEENADGNELVEDEEISEETERKYLTLSWWILHVGWKDVGERVRKGVEEVFDAVSLKTKLTASDLHRLFSDVRRRVEYEVTFEQHERRINFMSTLLPPTSETLQHVLTQGGIPARLAAAPDAKFESLLSETRTHLQSASFERVLEVCLDQATDVFFRSIQKHVFSASGEPASALGDEPRERLAAMLPGLARWCHLALEGLPNELVDGLTNLREVSALSAIIYSSYEDRYQ